MGFFDGIAMIITVMLAFAFGFFFGMDGKD